MNSKLRSLCKIFYISFMIASKAQELFMADLILL